MEQLRALDGLEVHCRTGSLESQVIAVLMELGVHCRTGSLEMVK